MRRSQRRKRRWPKILGFSLLGLVIIGGLALVFSTQLNNGWRNMNGGQDTPVDTAIKGQVETQLDKSKTGNPVTDAIIDTAVTKIKTTSMSTFMAAARNEEKLTTLLSQSTGLPTTVTQPAAKAMFTNQALAPLREALAAGDWIKVGKEAQNLKQNQALGDLLTPQSN